MNVGLRETVIISTIAGGALAIVCGLVFASVVARAVFNIAIPDSFEMTRHIMAIALFWGLALTLKDKELITLDLLYNVVSVRSQLWLRLLTATTTVVVLSIMTFQFSLHVYDMAMTQQVTIELGIIVWPVYFIADLGLLLATIKAINAVFALYYLLNERVEVLAS